MRVWVPRAVIGCAPRTRRPASAMRTQSPQPGRAITRDVTLICHRSGVKRTNWRWSLAMQSSAFLSGAGIGPRGAVRQWPAGRGPRPDGTGCERSAALALGTQPLRSGKSSSQPPDAGRLSLTSKHTEQSQYFGCMCRSRSWPLYGVRAGLGEVQQRYVWRVAFGWDPAPPTTSYGDVYRVSVCSSWRGGGSPLPEAFRGDEHLARQRPQTSADE